MSLRFLREAAWVRERERRGHLRQPRLHLRDKRYYVPCHTLQSASPSSPESSEALTHSATGVAIAAEAAINEIAALLLWD